MARKKKPKIGLDALPPLTQNPFAALGSEFGVAQQKEAAQRESPAEPSAQQATLMVRLEKRKHGKAVTCVYHYEGDGKRLLKQMKRALGTGGGMGEQCLELQGDHRDAAAAYLRGEGLKSVVS